MQAITDRQRQGRRPEGQGDSWYLLDPEVKSIKADEIFTEPCQV